MVAIRTNVLRQRAPTIIMHIYFDMLIALLLNTYHTKHYAVYLDHISVINNIGCRLTAMMKVKH